MKSLPFTALLLVFSVTLAGCQHQVLVDETSQGRTESSDVRAKPIDKQDIQNPGRLIHIVVALCDNRYQGIVPVPEKIGNGDDPNHNLYWGAAYGVKTFFRKSKDWQLIHEISHPKQSVLQRIVFKHRSKNVYIVADAYRGRDIRQTTIDFLRFAAGRKDEIIEVPHDSQTLVLRLGAGADLVAYVGHDGLMDFTLAEYPSQSDRRQRDVIVLACASKIFFGEAIGKTGANPLLWTTGLMAPESYVLRSAIDGWLLNDHGDGIRKRAAEAYDRYQRCGMKAALNLFSNGW